MTKTLTATFNGQTFTRKTDRTYTHVVLYRDSYELTLALRVERAKYEARVNYPYYVQQANPETRKYNPSAAQIADYQRITSLTQDEYLQELLAKAHACNEELKADGYFDTYKALGWCGRPDLAQKSAQQARAKNYYADIVVVPVNA